MHRNMTLIVFDLWTFVFAERIENEHRLVGRKGENIGKIIGIIRKNGNH